MNVRDAFHEILRTHGITTIFGNPGTNEPPRSASAASPTPEWQVGLA
jgi:thiamine pyrophosphate-dependent acetolactate synthase large subunit-like protein